MREHVGVPADRLQHQSQIVMGFGHARVERDRLADEFERGIVVAQLMRDEAEKIQALGVARVARENVAVEPLGLVQFAGLMMPHRLRKYRSEFGRARRRRAHGAAGLLFGRPPVLAVH